MAISNILLCLLYLVFKVESFPVENYTTLTLPTSDEVSRVTGLFSSMESFEVITNDDATAAILLRLKDVTDENLRNKTGSNQNIGSLLAIVRDLENAVSNLKTVRSDILKTEEYLVASRDLIKIARSAEPGDHQTTELLTSIENKLEIAISYIETARDSLDNSTDCFEASSEMMLLESTSTGYMDSLLSTADRKLENAIGYLKISSGNFENAMDYFKDSQEMMLTLEEIINTERGEAFDSYISKKEKKYELVKIVKTNWYNAKRYCKEKGMELATIENKEEQKKLDSVIGRVGFDIGSVLTAGTDLETTGQFYWRTPGTPMDYTNWERNEPSGTDEHCIVVYLTGTGYFWNDDNCDSDFHFVCQYF